MTIFRFDFFSKGLVLIIAGLAFALAVPLSGASNGYYSTQHERADSSNVIVIAKARAFETRVATGDIEFLGQIRVVNFETAHVIKGSVDDQFEVDPIDYVAEVASVCCEIGRHYVLYLVEVDGLYYPADRFSMVPIDGM